MSERRSRRQPSVLVVDDSLDTQEVLQRNLVSRGYKVHTATGVTEAMALLQRDKVDLVITDLKMPRKSGLELVRHVRENLPDAEVMMITGYASVEGAVQAVKLGAEEYLSKPFTDEELFAAVDRVLERLGERRAARAGQAGPVTATGGIVGESPAILRVLQAISRTSRSLATVLITGESGVGKELVARAIHESGPRSGAPFVPVNCGAIPAELVESELFGHARGAFTGATSAAEGLFVAAHGGTILLDEISEMSHAVQVKVLRVLQDQEVWRVGSTQPRRVDVRILAATNKYLPALVEQGALREDLFFRLSVITIEVPPLRGRDNDVILLANHLLGRLAAREGRPAPRLSDGALRALKGYHWPGNIRELENLMNQLVVMVEGETIDIADLPAILRYSINCEDAPRQTLAEVEAAYIRRVLESLGGNKTQAARILGIDRKTLREKLRI